MKRSTERWLTGVLVLVCGAYAVAEELRMVSYYPSPRAVYEEVRVQSGVAKVAVTTPGTQTTHESRVEFITRDNPGNGQLEDAGSVGWRIHALGDRFVSGKVTAQQNDLVVSRWSGSAETAPFVIDFANDRIGIGTITPTQRLELGSGNILLPSANAGTDGNLYFGGITNAGQIGMRFFGGLVNGATPAGFIDIRTTDPNEGLRFRVDTVQASIERMRITAAGNVGIGTATPDNDNLLVVNGPIEVGDWLETSQPNNRFRFCGSGTNPARCNAASELIAGRIKLSADGSFASGEGQVDPGFGGMNVPGMLMGDGLLGLGTTGFSPGITAQVNGNTRVTGKLTVDPGNIFAGGNIAAAGAINGRWIFANDKLCIGTDCITAWPPAPPQPCPAIGDKSCTWHIGGGCGDPMPRWVRCPDKTWYIKAVRLKIVGGCGDVKNDFGVDIMCCQF